MTRKKLRCALRGPRIYPLRVAVSAVIWVLLALAVFAC